MDIKYQQHKIAVTVSLGVGVSSHLKEFDKLFQRTDKALYRAKNWAKTVWCLLKSESYLKC
jgi:PleD family two-component response regulator